MSTTTGTPSAAELRRDVDGAGEAGDHEVRGVDLEDERGVRADGVGVVGAASTRFVVPTSRSRAPVDGEQVGDAEAVADLDQLAAGDDDLAPGGQRGGDEDERGGAVVDHVRGARGGDGARAARRRRLDRGRRGAPVARSSSTSHVPAATSSARRAAGGQRRAAEVGVQQHAGGVEHRPQGGGGVGQLVEDGVDDGLRRDLAAPDPLLRAADRLLDQRRGPAG